MHTTTMRTVTLLVLAAAGLVFSEAHAANIWTGSESSDWFEGLNWSEGHYPAAGEDVVVDSGANILLTNATADLGSFTLNGGTLTFSNWTTRLIATNVTLSGGTVTHTLTDTNAMPSTTNRVVIQCSNLTVEVGGTIDVSAVGFRGGDSIGRGHGPGGGISFNAFGTSYGGGGGYGGNGGKGYDKAYGGVKHGSAAAVVLPGSGGGGEEGRGGHGGGLCVIEASGHVQLDGSILANGRNSIAIWGGGGSGGGISITCRTIDGSGTLRADGGTGSGNGGGGGGGRIAIAYDPGAQAIQGVAALRLSALGETGGQGNGGMGSLYTPDIAMVGSFWFWNAYLHLATANLEMGSSVIVSNGSVGFATNMIIHVAGNLMVTNNGKLYLQGGLTTTNTAYASLLAVSHDVAIAAGCGIYPESHPTNGGSVKLVMSNLTLQAGAEINANGLGYQGGQGLENGYGPGYGRTAPPTDRGSGAGYGGDGGDGTFSAGGAAYGSPSEALHPGSGGGSGGVNLGGRGGGLIWIEASGNVRIDGKLSADAATDVKFGGPIGYCGGGSGGGIRLVCDTVSGNGTLTARGASSGIYGGGGSGGRIALLYNPDSQPQISPQPYYSISVAGGTGYQSGGLGSLYVADASFYQQPVLSHSAILHAPTTTIAYPSSLIVSNGAVGFGRGISVTVDGDLNLVSGGSLRLQGGITSANTEPGATLEVSGDITIPTNCTLYPESHPTNGGSVKLVMRNLTIEIGGAINADGLGYQRGIGREDGYGPGKGGNHPSYDYGGGAGYGGAGSSGIGGGAYGKAGEVYGISNAPAWPGSGGGGTGGGNGGGFVWIESSGIVSVNGRIGANGANSTRQYGGGGSGGGIRIRCQELTGTGALQAAGGNGWSHGGGAGGGRIAVLTRLTDNAVSQLLNEEWPPRIIIRSQEDYDTDFTVGAGTSSQGYTGDDGTIVIMNQHPPAGTMISIH